MKPQKRPSCLIFVGALVLSMCAVPATWCVGVWGRQSVRTQQFLQPYCPAATDQWRYHPFQILTSANDGYYFLSISPSRRYMIAGQYGGIGNATEDRVSLFDLVALASPPKTINRAWRFLTDSLVISRKVDDYGNLTIWDIETDEEFYIRSILVSDGGSLDEQTLALLRNAERIIAVTGRYIIALAGGASPAPHSVALRGYEQVIPVLQREGLAYTEVPENGVIIEEHWLGGENKRAVPSGNGLFWARPEGIYLAETGELLLATGYVGYAEVNPEQRQIYLSPVGWTPDDQAVIYTPQVNWYRAYWPLVWDEPPPQPILLLELPTQYQSVPVTPPAP